MWVKGAVAYLRFSVGRNNGFFLISVSSMQVVCFLSARVVFANSFMLHSNLVLENSSSGKCTSVTAMQDIWVAVYSSSFLYSLKHVTIYDSGMLLFLFQGGGRDAVVTAGACCGQFNLWFAAEVFRIFSVSTKLEDIVQLKEIFISFAHSN